MEIRYTLIADGSFDEALIPVINWALRERDEVRSIEAQFADLGSLRLGSRSLPERVEAAIRYFPCNLLLVHRDAERDDPEARRNEIVAAVGFARGRGQQCQHVCVVPVRMTEAWLLFDETAIRRASGNPNGRNPFNLPRIATLERLPDPKAVLRNLLQVSSGLRGRHLKRFNPASAARRVAELTNDFSPLRRLAAFQAFETELDLALARI